MKSAHSTARFTLLTPHPPLPPHSHSNPNPTSTHPATSTPALTHPPTNPRSPPPPSPPAPPTYLYPHLHPIHSHPHATPDHNSLVQPPPHTPTPISTLYVYSHFHPDPPPLPLTSNSYHYSHPRPRRFIGTNLSYRGYFRCLVDQIQVKTSETLALMDVKVRDLMATAAAALMSGGTFLLAHECRSDLRDVMKLFETVSVHVPRCWSTRCLRGR